MKMFDFKDIKNTYFKYPQVFLFLAGGSLLFYLADLFNPLGNIILGTAGTVSGRGILAQDFMSFFKSFLISIQIIFGFKFFSVKGLFVVMFLWGLLSITFAAFFALFFGLVRLAALQEKIQLKEIASTFKVNFKSLFFVFLLMFPITLILLFFLGVSSVPAVIMSEMSIIKNGVLSLPVLFLDFITFIIVFFGLLFYSIYFFMWIPSIILDGGRILYAFRRGMSFVDRKFGLLLGEFALLDLIFVILQAVTFIVKYSMSGTVRMEGFSFGGLLFFIINWLIKTSFLTVVVIYFFDRYQKIKTESD